MLLFGPQAEIEIRTTNEGEVEHVRLLSVISDDRAMEQVLGAVSLRETPYGLRFSSSQSLPRSSSTAGEAHRDQALAIMAQLGIPLSQPFNLRNRHYTGRSVLADSVMTFSIAQPELPWSAVAYCHYLSGQTSWENKFGEVFTFDTLADELLRRSLDQESCGGLHVLQALTVIRSARHDGKPIISNIHAANIDQYINKYIAIATRGQRDAHGWGSDWCRPPAGNTAPRSTSDRVVVTGHMLEWMLMLPDHQRPDATSVRRAVDHLQHMLDAHPVQAPSLPVCPYTHARLAIAGWTNFRASIQENQR